MCHSKSDIQFCPKAASEGWQNGFESACNISIHFVCSHLTQTVQAAEMEEEEEAGVGTWHALFVLSSFWERDGMLEQRSGMCHGAKTDHISYKTKKDKVSTSRMEQINRAM
jgi:hypothetical protein